MSQLPARVAPFPRARVWLQWAIGWLPLWALFTTLMAGVHSMPMLQAAGYGARLMACAALLGLGVHRITQRQPWPYPFRPSFVALHALAAVLYSLAWIALNSVVDSVLNRRLGFVMGPGLLPYFVTGVWLYVMIAGVGYAHSAAEREAQLKALAARSQLAALRMQLHPHFLFNALHTVVQLIHLEPRAAVRAAEQLSDLLRSTLQEHREQLPLADEWTLVQRYLAIESLRLGDRLQVQTHFDAAVLEAQVPSFVLQTLVENAVRHAAAPAPGSTTLHISARREGACLVLTVADSGALTDLSRLHATQGTGLQRLRERLRVLHGNPTALQFQLAQPQGLVATVHLPYDDSPVAPPPHVAA